MATEDYHWIKQSELDKKLGGVTQCGEKIFQGMRFCTEPSLPVINCKKCKELYFEQQKQRTQKLCSFCPTPLRNEDYENTNDFYLSCFQHKRLGQIETEKFFKENPDYTNWALK